MKRILLILILSLGACTTSVQRHTSAPQNQQSLRNNLKLRFIWPVKNPRITSYYGWRSSKRIHEGLDMGGKTGTSIYAAESGVVIHSGWIRGFGQAVIIKHKYDWSTLYGHLSKVNVKKGQYVRQGYYIGGMGRTGRATGVHLHFEIRKGADPLDPILFLPPLRR